MARIIGGIGTSHVPTIAMAFDKGKHEDPDWKPLFKGYEPVAKWLAEKKPDVLFFCFNDHATTFFFDHYPTFALGVSDEYPIADEGLGARKIPTLKGHAELSRHVARSLVDDEFDMTVFQDLALDHGLHSPLTMMWPSQSGLAGARGAAGGQRAAAPAAHAEALLQAGQGDRQGDPVLSGGSEGGDGRHRRPVAPDDRRARGIQRREVGPRVPRPHRPRPRAPGEHEHRGLRPPGAATRAPR